MTEPRRNVSPEIQGLLDRKRAWHRRCAELPVVEKVRILLDLQRQDLPLIARHRALEWWEQPWDIDP